MKSQGSGLVHEEHRAKLTEARYLDAGLWGALDAALRERAPMNIFGLRGYGRSTLLDACRAWLDTYLVSVPFMVLTVSSA